MNALALMISPIRHGWAVYLTDGRELARFSGPAAKWRAGRYLARIRCARRPGPPPHPRATRRRRADLGSGDRRVRGEFGISQPGVSAHLRVLRESGFTTVRPEGARRLYAVSPEPLRDASAWLDGFRRFWTPHLDALETELARGKRERRVRAQASEQNTTGEAG